MMEMALSVITNSCGQKNENTSQETRFSESSSLERWNFRFFEIRVVGWVSDEEVSPEVLGWWQNPKSGLDAETGLNMADVAGKILKAEQKQD